MIIKILKGYKAMKNSEFKNLPSESYCGTKMAANLLGLSVGTIQNLVESKKLTAWKTEGGHRRILLESVIEYQNVNGIKDVKKPLPIFEHQIIIVEDDENTINMIDAYFDRWKLPLELIVYPSAMNALLDWHLLNPLVLLTDLKMPNINGFDFIKTIRKKIDSQNIPIIVITGLSDEEIVNNGGLPEDIMILKKPLDMEWLKGFLQGLVIFNLKDKKL